jgi:hypothetical protein
MLAIEGFVSFTSRYPACELQFLEGEHIQSYPYLQKVCACDSVIKNITVRVDSSYKQNENMTAMEDVLQLILQSLTLKKEKVTIDNSTAYCML